MVYALKDGLVPPGNINVTDSQGQQTLMAKGQVASTFCDYSGTVGTLYDVPDSSSVVGQVVLPADARRVTGSVANLNNPDGIGIPDAGEVPEGGGQVHRVVHRHRQPDRLRRRQRTGQGAAGLPDPVAALGREGDDGEGQADPG